MKPLLCFFIICIFTFNFSYAQTNTFPQNGNVGIGTTTPEEKLVVTGNQKLFGNLSFGSDQTAYFIKGSGNGGAIRLRTNIAQAVDRDIQFGNIDNNGSWNSYMTVAQTGYVGIGTTNPDARLAVNGTIHSREVKVDMNSWPDYVFGPKYKLLPLSEIKTYIDQNQHLPEMPSAIEVEASGLNLGDINRLLTKKVEELTLYLLEKDTEVNILNSEITLLKKNQRDQQIQLHFIKDMLDKINLKKVSGSRTQDYVDEKE